MNFLATWTVELAVHHLDLGSHLDVDPPAAPAMRLARTTVETLAGEAAPASWADDTVVLLGTGRTTATEQQQREAPRFVRAGAVLG